MQNDTHRRYVQIHLDVYKICSDNYHKKQIAIKVQKSTHSVFPKQQHINNQSAITDHLPQLRYCSAISILSCSPVVVCCTSVSTTPESSPIPLYSVSTEIACAFPS